MHWFGFDLAPLLIFGIPIVAIVGGITAGIVKNMNETRIIENAQRERMLAIQQGLDPTKLPPMPVPPSFETRPDLYSPLTFTEASRRRAQGLLVGGIVTLFTGLGLGLFLYYIGDAAESNAWAIGIIPTMVGIGLLIGSLVVWPRGQNRQDAWSQPGGPQGPGGPAPR
jgi:hypothetical protein